MAQVRARIPHVLAVLGLVLAAGAGFLTSQAGGAADPVRTVTVDVGTGPSGPQGPSGAQGPTGPQGPAGDFSCIAGYSPAIVQINAAHGHVRIYACVEDQ